VSTASRMEAWLRVAVGVTVEIYRQNPQKEMAFITQLTLLRQGKIIAVVQLFGSQQEVLQQVLLVIPAFGADEAVFSAEGFKKVIEMQPDETLDEAKDRLEETYEHGDLADDPQRQEIVYVFYVNKAGESKMAGVTFHRKKSGIEIDWESMTFVENSVGVIQKVMTAGMLRSVPDKMNMVSDVIVMQNLARLGVPAYLRRLKKAQAELAEIAAENAILAYANDLFDSGELSTEEANALFEMFRP
jgi:hypothetical protein